MAEQAKKETKEAPPAEKKGEAAAAGAGGKKAGGGSLLKSTPVLLGVVMIIEAAVLFAAFKMLGGGGPKPAQAAELVAESAKGGGHGEAGGEAGKAEHKQFSEVKVLDFKAPNKLTGKTFLYDVSVFLVTKGDNEERAKAAVKEREALIQDRMRTIIAQSDPEKLGGGSEPGLETLRRQVKYQLDEILGEGLVEEVLVPKCTPYRHEF